MIAIVFWVLILGILWRVPEFKFLAFFILANNALYTLMIGWGFTAEMWTPYLMSVVIGDLVFATIATPLIIFRKWQRAQQGNSGGRADKEMDRIRAEIAARNAQPPASPR